MRTRESGGLAVILDTNAVSAWAEHDPSALRLIEAQGFLCLPVIVLGEFRFGLRGSRKRAVNLVPDRISRADLDVVSG